tara:strand:- start:17071 stop:17601 length:531 start_codon:yes stop_codon:yes gene_type:complete
LINIIGLAIGMTACLIIALFVHGELGYDRHHPGADRIYRILRGIHNPGKGQEMSVRTSGALADALQTEFPEVEETIRIRRMPRIAISAGARGFDRWSFATDSNALSFFDLPLVRGDEATALQSSAPILLTQPLARDRNLRTASTRMRRHSTASSPTSWPEAWARKQGRQTPGACSP